MNGVAGKDATQCCKMYYPVKNKPWYVRISGLNSWAPLKADTAASGRFIVNNKFP